MLQAKTGFYEEKLVPVKEVEDYIKKVEAQKKFDLAFTLN